MSALLGSLLPYIIAAGAAIAGVFAAYLKGRSEGKQTERAKQAVQRQKAIDTANKVESEVDALPSDKAREELKKWAR